MSFAKILFGIQLALNMVFDFGGITHLVTRLMLDLPYSRKLELEADAIGLSLMAAACYDPAASPAMFGRLAKLGGGGDGGRAARLLSTHPVFDERIARLHTLLPGARDGYASRCGIAGFRGEMARRQDEGGAHTRW
jgi:metalloendopeptidase OMA1, mitochondrial